MDLDSTPTKSADDTDLDTPPQAHTPSIKSHHPHLPPPASVAYKECMKNHAANIGGHAVDGCGEYMPPPSAVPTDPISLICAACGCHRNFHRRRPVTPITPPFLNFRRPGQSTRANPASSSATPPFPYSPHMLLAAVAGEEHHHHPATPAAENPLGRKRLRTKFSQEQKEKMHAFSEKLGWRMQKSDAAAVEEFCRDAGVARGVLKVWMHNNKNSFGRKETVINSRSDVNVVGGGSMSLGKSINGGDGDGDSKNEEITRKSDDHDNDNENDNGGRFQNGSGGRVHFHHSNNGSCSSP